VSDAQVSEPQVDEAPVADEWLSTRKMFALKAMEELYPHASAAESMTEEEMIDFLALEWVTADNELARIKDKEGKLREVIVRLANAKDKGTTVLTTSDFDIKISRSLQGKYPKVGDRVPAQELFTNFPEVRDAFRVTFEEKFTTMQETVDELERLETEGLITDHQTGLLSFLRQYRKVSSSSPQVKASKRS